MKCIHIRLTLSALFLVSMISTLLLLLLTSCSGAVTVYQPNETYAVHNIDKEVVDDSRTYMGQPYRIMTTMFYPVDVASHCIAYDKAYMPALTADYNTGLYGSIIGAPLPPSTFDSIKLRSCNSSSWLAWLTAARRWPLTILSSVFWCWCYPPVLLRSCGRACKSWVHCCNAR